MRTLYFIIISLIFSCAANASEKYYFRHYTNKDGLSHNTVYCSLQDKKGFMWFGTDDGLNRFDGYSFQMFRHNYNDNETLLNDHILSLFEDSSGKIWICTQKGICYYDYETDKFHTFILDVQSSPYYADQIFEDKNGFLWMRDYSNITRYDPKNNSYKIFNYNETGLRSAVMDMTETGIPAFADAACLYIFDPKSEKFNRIVDLTNFRRSELMVISALKEIPQVGFLIGTDQEGLLLFNSNTKHVETIIPETHIRSIMRYNVNTYWIASESGVYIYNLIDKSVINLKKSLTNDYDIADNAVYWLTKDREGGIWVTSFFGGINYLSRNHNNFTYYIGGKTHPDMPGNTVRDICPDKYGNLWLGTEDNGINRYDPKTDKMENYSQLNPVRKLSASNIHGLYAEGDTLWIGSFNKGIDMLHIPTGKIIGSYSMSSTNNQLISNFILCFYTTSKGEFLLGTSAGVVLFDKKSKTFSRWKKSNVFVRQILEDSAGNIWVSTTNGMYKYAPASEGKEESVTGYTETPASNSYGLGHTNTTSVFEDSKKRIWVTTSSGFSYYNKHEDSFVKISQETGFPSNMVYRIVEDGNNMFWISTANGLVRFDPETHEMHTYSYSDGLHETQFNFSSSYINPQGVIYMGTINGMISFNPKNFPTDAYIPSLYITKVQDHDNPNKSISLLKHYSDDNILKFPYNSSTFTVSYIAPGYTSPDAIKYSYFLEGVDKEWIYMDNNKNVTFASLSPGKYVFKVRSTDVNGVWQDNQKSLRIVITPPFWLTNTAFIFYFVFIISSVVAFYKYKKRTFVEKANRNRKLFEMEKDKELFNAKIQFFTFITHEIRTPLSLIKAPLEKIIKSGDGTGETKQNLKVIEKNTSRLLDLSNQLLDFRKTESRGFRLNFVKTNVTLLVENILSQFTNVFYNESKTFTVDIDNKHVFAYIDRDAFIKIVTNMLSNALKYSTDYVSLKMIPPDDNDQEFKIIVTNDGFLIPEKERENIFSPFFRLKENENTQGSGIGLSLSRTLTEFHNGTLTFSETPNGLNRFTLALPVIQKNYNFDLMEDPEVEVVAEDKTYAKISDRNVVLIVEDQNDMRKFLIGELSSQYDIQEAENGKEALKILEKEKIDLIISDVMMPVMDGFELCNKVKNDINFSHLPFIILTAQHNLQSLLTGLNQGADAYLEKPFSLEHLSAQIENLFKNREILRKSYLEKPYTPVSSLAVSLVDQKFLRKLNDYIDENLTNENLSVEMIAENMNMSNSSLYRKVKGISDLSPIDFIRMSRLKKAVQLMQEGEKRISEIAFIVGFSSPAYFSTCFQKQYGKSPSEFMKEVS